MKKWFFLGLSLPILLLALSVCCFQSVPTYEGLHYSSSIKSDIKITRDSKAIPYIQASTPEDAFYALGYVHAEDRLWSMDIYRRVSTGTLSEFFSSFTLEVDKFSRNIGLSRHSQRDYAEYSSESQSYLKAYSAGINEYVRTHYLPPEYILTWTTWKEWTPTDTLAIMKFFSFGLSLMWGHEFLRNYLEFKLGKPTVDLILPDDSFKDLYPQTYIVEDSDIPEALRRNTTAEYVSDVYVQDLIAIDETSFTQASNAWVISGKYTKSGKPIISNDPHLSTKIPALFYLADCNVTGQFTLTGASIPGMPIFISGKNEHIAWGSTALMADTVDLYLEKRNQTDYLYSNNTWVKFENITEEIKVRGRGTYEMIIENTLHGPILHNYGKEGQTYSPFYHPYSIDKSYAFRWAPLTKPDMSFEGFMAVTIAKTPEEFTNALNILACPHLGLVYATDKDIGFKIVGRIPVRNYKSNRVLPGWDPNFEWKGFIEDPLHIKNPEKGYIVAANNSPANSYKFSVGHEFSETRARRISQLIEGKITTKKVDVSDMLEIQCDVFQIDALEIISYLKQFIKMPGLDQWDFQMNANSSQPYLFAIMFRNMCSFIMEDEMSDSEMHTLMRSIWYRLFVKRVFSEEPDAAMLKLCDDQRTDEVESCLDIADKAYKSAELEFAGKKWGDMHTVWYKHEPFSVIPSFYKQFPIGGSDTTVLASAFDWARNFVTLHAAIVRFVHDWGGETSMSLSTGQSGHFLSPYYADQAEGFIRCRNLEWDPRNIPEGKMVDILKQ